MALRFWAMTCQFTLRKSDKAAILAALSRYPHHYDESFCESADRIATNGYATKLDIGGLAAWKRIRCDTPWVTKLQSLPQTTVTTATRKAFLPGLTPARRLETLRSDLKHGMGGAFALGSALLTAWNQTEFAVTDRRTRAALRSLLRPVGCACDFGYYPTYVEHVAEIRNQMTTARGDEVLSSRDIDKALYVLLPSG